MYKLVILLLPVFSTLYWSIKLHLGEPEESCKPKYFLGKFMICTLLLYISHLVYYLEFESIYLIVDSFYQLISLLVYPLFHIYIRLLTIDNGVSFKRHGKILTPPVIVSVIYLITSILASAGEYKNYLFENERPESVMGMIYYITAWFVKMVFLIQVIFYVNLNSVLLKKYSHKAELYYSNIRESRVVKAKSLNIVMLIAAISSLILNVLGRQYFIYNIPALTAAAIIFSSLLFFIGYLGQMQQLINPFFEKIEVNVQGKTGSAVIVGEPLKIEEHQLNSFERVKIEELKKELGKKLEKAMNIDKMFLNSNLNIRDMASHIGSNRTYVSNYINTEKRVSFCAFVNRYRYKELESVLLSNEKVQSIESLALRCGFGSTDSMKRAVKNESGMTFRNWRESLKYKDID
ncbi:MAG TPA: AraC family transcriptional regulator [Bacteroidaceae bacterium]|nr:AraC family transcriptional regulator [Bacteroidaceae bacterium]